MSDLRLRELERRWRETGAVADEAEYLLARARVGLLDRAQLRVAASCGHAGAMTALGRPELGRRGAWLGHAHRLDEPLKRRIAVEVAAHLEGALAAVEGPARRWLEPWQAATPLARRVLAGQFSRGNPDDMCALMLVEAQFLDGPGSPSDPASVLAERAYRACFGWLRSAPAMDPVDLRAIVEQALELLVRVERRDVDACFSSLLMRLRSGIAEPALGSTRR